MRISDWSSDVCSSDLVEGEDGDHGADRDIFAAVAASDPVVEGSGAALDLGERQRGERRVAALPQAMQVFVVGHAAEDRKSGVWGKSVSVRVALGGRRIVKKTKENDERN